jgi:hypothetical protein
VIRLLVILLLATSGILRFPLAAGGSHGDCGHQACATEIATTPGCCESETLAPDFCPMSGGPCECGFAPLPDQQPAPYTPLPKTERDSVTAVPTPPIRVEVEVVAQRRSFVWSSIPLSLLAGLTHNEIQALLGIWRT